MCFRIVAEQFSESRPIRISDLPIEHGARQSGKFFRFVW
jgi:hypothetical protein